MEFNLSGQIQYYRFSLPFPTYYVYAFCNYNINKAINPVLTAIFFRSRDTMRIHYGPLYFLLLPAKVWHIDILYTQIIVYCPRQSHSKQFRP